MLLQKWPGSQCWSGVLVARPLYVHCAVPHCDGQPEQGDSCGAIAASSLLQS